MEKKIYTHMKTSDTIRTILKHPAFDGFSQLILPLEFGYQVNMPLSKVQWLLPYHSNVRSKNVVDTINYMIDEVADGQKIFCDIYSNEEKKKDSEKNNTGLFFFRGKTDKPFAIVCPGGGFSYVGSIHEGFPHAIELSKQGYNAFVIQYRVGGVDVACEDLAAAIAYVFSYADELGVSTKYYSLWGSSAGARMAAYLGSYGTKRFGKKELPRPSAVIMAYTGHSDYTRNDPSTFVVVGQQDGIANASTMKRRVDALDRLGIDTELHEYSGVGHGFGLGIGTSAEGWLNEAVRFWKISML
ncbi:alpha/beta hydrolase [Clostridium felsineum]|uniref:alpha/beta hydrolase n=1 Tax=Clostridium felsineum TaxID=36839 RepID=UPI0009CAF138|nr:alpha/beta hydrolase [Clostridium felsineum]URZ16658.1 hypothetical protein CLFE_027050 [Clostridium felsineum DSM 794]